MRCPFYLRTRTFTGTMRMSALCQYRTISAGAFNLTDRSKLSHREGRECRSPPQSRHRSPPDDLAPALFRLAQPINPPLRSWSSIPNRALPVLPQLRASASRRWRRIAGLRGTPRCDAIERSLRHLVYPQNVWWACRETDLPAENRPAASRLLFH
jgi:hypothetical protein